MKVKDGIIGLLIGDALGVPVEFEYRENLEKYPVTDMIGHGTYDQPEGTWSDDTSMTLATMASIVDKKAVDYDDIMENFCKWYKKEVYWQTPRFDAGITTASALYNYLDGMPALECGLDGERDNGNGSLMRILPMVVKDFGISMVYKFTGEKATSCLVTNVGVVKAPKEMEQYIEKLVLITGPAMINGARCGVLSYNGTLAFTVSNIYVSTEIQRAFFSTLVKLGIPVKIESNKSQIMGGDR